MTKCNRIGDVGQFGTQTAEVQICDTIANSCAKMDTIVQTTGQPRCSVEFTLV